MVVAFVVNRDGSISDVEVARSVDPSLDNEALRVINSMPRWIPGQQGGKNVRVRYTLPLPLGFNDIVDSMKSVETRGRVSTL